MKTLIIRNIPDDVHKKFKIMCAEKDTSMNQEIIKLMKEAVDKYFKKK
ncbi:MAG: FitA-like ribbon-helix-helix domain-containing protein [Promethearchaeota archaeon]